MGIALAKLAEEDPTFRTYTDEETGQTIIAGMGELHLEIIVDRLLREFKVEANVGAPQVAYRETIRRPADQGHQVRASVPAVKASYGHVKIKIEPNEAGKGYEFVNAIVGGAIPKEFIGPIDQGIQGAMQGRRACRLSRCGTSRSRCTMVPTMRSTPPKWRLRSPVPWPSKRLCVRRIPLFWSRL